MPPNNAVDWFERADCDLLNIENNLASRVVPWATVVFHAHEAIEKYVKGLLVANGAMPRKTHDLVELIRECKQFAPELPQFEQDCRLLNRLYIHVAIPKRRRPGSLTLADRLKWRRESRQ